MPDSHNIAQVFKLCTAVATLLLVSKAVAAQPNETKPRYLYGPHGYEVRPTSHTATKHSLALDINVLWKVASKKHPCTTTRSEIASVYSTFESSLQRAADELDTGEPARAGWAAELISDYTRPTHRFPATSKSLDRALTARTKLIELTDVKTVQTSEEKLKRFATSRGSLPPIGDWSPGP